MATTPEDTVGATRCALTRDTAAVPASSPLEAVSNETIVASIRAAVREEVLLAVPAHLPGSSGSSQPTATEGGSQPGTSGSATPTSVATGE